MRKIIFLSLLILIGCGIIKQSRKENSTLTKSILNEIIKKGYIKDEEVVTAFYKEIYQPILQIQEANLDDDKEREKIISFFFGDYFYLAVFNSNLKLLDVCNLGFRVGEKPALFDLTNDGQKEIVIISGTHSGTNMFTEYMYIFKLKAKKLVKIWSSIKKIANGPYQVSEIVTHQEAKISFEDTNEDGIKEIVKIKTLKKVQLTNRYKIKVLKKKKLRKEIFKWNQNEFKYISCVGNRVK